MNSKHKLQYVKRTLFLIFQYISQLIKIEIRLEWIENLKFYTSEELKFRYSKNVNVLIYLKLIRIKIKLKLITNKKLDMCDILRVHYSQNMWMYPTFD